jgi:hypothetical protein
MKRQPKENPIMTKTTLRLPADLLRAAKIHAVKGNTTLQEVVEASLRSYLASRSVKENS